MMHFPESVLDISLRGLPPELFGCQHFAIEPPLAFAPAEESKKKEGIEQIHTAMDYCSAVHKKKIV